MIMRASSPVPESVLARAEKQPSQPLDCDWVCDQFPAWLSVSACQRAKEQQNPLTIHQVG